MKLNESGMTGGASSLAGRILSSCGWDMMDFELGPQNRASIEHILEFRGPRKGILSFRSTEERFNIKPSDAPVDITKLATSLALFRLASRQDVIQCRVDSWASDLIRLRNNLAR